MLYVCVLAGPDNKMTAVTLYSSVCIFSILFSIHSLGLGKENLLNNQELLLLVIISFIFVTLMFNSGMIL